MQKYQRFRGIFQYVLPSSDDEYQQAIKDPVIIRYLQSMQCLINMVREGLAKQSISIDNLVGINTTAD